MRFWANFTFEKSPLLKNIYQKTVHWSAIFFGLNENKTVFLFADTLKITLSLTTTKSGKCEYGMVAAMVMPHFVLVRSKLEKDGSNSESIQRRLDQWLNFVCENFFKEATSQQKRLKNWKLSKKRILIKSLIATCLQENYLLLLDVSVTKVKEDYCPSMEKQQRMERLKVGWCFAKKTSSAIRSKGRIHRQR